MPTTASTPLAERAQALVEVLAGAGAVLRPEQLAAIEAIVAERRRALVVQRTGFGKSGIYFIATKLLREEGGGPTLVVSPLLALMRDQVAAAERMGVRSATVNSTNVDDWAEIEGRLAAGDLDLLCISPERLNNPRFVRNVLPGLAQRLGLLVVDEAHCISDWGHDFRPDYRRIRDAIAALGAGVPVLATTATANQRVTDDVAEQLGHDVLVLRGTLDRPSLRLGVTALPSLAERLAWLAQRIPQLPGTGIVYCLTVARTQEVAAWLRQRGIDARAYSSDTAPEERAALEDDFKANRVKALVATSALGMGVDKPDVAFVCHLGAPPSPIAYYQQVGRAGRSLDVAHAWLLPGEDDRRIWDWFAAVGLPPEALVRRVLEAIDAAGGEPVGLAQLERAVDLRRTRLEALLKILDVDGAVIRVDGGWAATGRPWAYDDRIARIRAARDAEADAMEAYGRAGSCLMEQLRAALDDPGAERCGRCAVCAGAGDPVELDAEVVREAVAFLRGLDIVAEPRKQWPRGLDVVKGNIGPARRAEEGRALCRVGDAGWWPAVAAAFESGAVDQELLDGVAAALKRWPWEHRPSWITWIPSTDDRREAVLRALAERLGAVGNREVAPVVRRVRGGRPQSSLHNAAHRCANVLGAFAVDGEGDELPVGPVLLLDDERDTGWTATVVAAELRDAGVPAVLPFALAQA